MQLSHYKKVFIFSYLLGVLLLWLYSFTQIDLGLTLVRYPQLYPLQQFFQSIGYFNRPLSASLFVGIMILLFVSYGALLTLAKQGKLGRKAVWRIILATTIVLGLAYNALSYDIFNYIFDAKIVTHYQQNPYLHKALDFPGDPMLAFMHWTHRTYPYGPTWLLLSIILSFVGAQYFVVTFLLFKILAMVSFVGMLYFVERLLQRLTPNAVVERLVLLGLNPLLLLEALVAGHNDIVMLFLGVWSLYALLEKRYGTSFFLLLFSIGIKFATIFLLPLYLWASIKRDVSKKTFFFVAMFVAMSIAVVFAAIRTELQPWYFLWCLPFVVLFKRDNVFVVPFFVVTFLLVLTYTPFLYTGNWDPPIPTIRMWMHGIAGGFVLFYEGYLLLADKKR